MGQVWLAKTGEIRSVAGLGQVWDRSGIWSGIWSGKSGKSGKMPILGIPEFREIGLAGFWKSSKIDVKKRAKKALSGLLWRVEKKWEKIFPPGRQNPAYRGAKTGGDRKKGCSPAAGTDEKTENSEKKSLKSLCIHPGKNWNPRAGFF